MDQQIALNQPDPKKVATAMVQMVIFELDQEEFAIPILEVKEVINLPSITPVPNSASFITGVINLRGKVLPVLDLEIKFNLIRSNKIPGVHVLIAQGGDETGNFGVLVDRVKEVVKIAQDSIKPTPQIITSKITADFIKGVLVQKSDGQDRIVLILDLKNILSQTDTQSLNASQTAVKNIDISQVQSGMINSDKHI